jgi:transposase
VTFALDDLSPFPRSSEVTRFRGGGHSLRHLVDSIAPFALDGRPRAPNAADLCLVESRSLRQEPVTEEMRAAVDLRLPEGSVKSKTGRPRVPDRDALRGIEFALCSRPPWEMAPREVFGGSGLGRPAAPAGLAQAGVQGRLHQVMPERRDRAGEPDLSRASPEGARGHPLSRPGLGVDVSSGARRDRWTASSSTGDRPPMDECRREGS